MKTSELKNLNLEEGLTLRKIGNRESYRGNVHDTYQLEVDGNVVMIIKPCIDRQTPGKY